MKQKTRNKLFAAWAWCDHNDKSTEFMFVFMADEASVNHDCVTSFVLNKTDDQRAQWYKDNSAWLWDWERSHVLCPECGDAVLDPLPKGEFSCPKCLTLFGPN